MHGGGGACMVGGGACMVGCMHGRGHAWWEGFVWQRRRACQETRLLQRTVRILLECILVLIVFVNGKGRKCTPLNDYMTDGQQSVETFLEQINHLEVYLPHSANASQNVMVITTATTNIKE